MTKKVFIVAAKRTPMGSFGGSLKGFSAVELGTFAINSAIDQAGIDSALIQEVFMGNVCQANLGQAPARQAALKANIPNSVPCTTINKVCASGMKSVAFGAQAIMLGIHDIVLAGGMESMSNVPYYAPDVRWGSKFGNGQLIDGLQKDGLTDAYDHCAMGVCGDATAEKFGFTREVQDAYAIRSYERAASATKAGMFKSEIAPVLIPQRKGDSLSMDEDEEFKNVIFEKIPTLRPAFSKTGTVTAANASTLNDGASALILASEEAVKKYDLEPLARIVSFADAAQEPKWFTTAPVLAAPMAIHNGGLKKEDIDFYEVNEAFSVVAMAFAKELNISEDIMNVNGGAVALGHPLGCSGARILTTLVYVLGEKKGEYGLATLCNGGGGASAMIIQKIN